MIKMYAERKDGLFTIYRIELPDGRVEEITEDVDILDFGCLLGHEGSDLELWINGEKDRPKILISVVLDENKSTEYGTEVYTIFYANKVEQETFNY